MNFRILILMQTLSIHKLTFLWVMAIFTLCKLLFVHLTSTIWMTKKVVTTYVHSWWYIVANFHYFLPWRIFHCWTTLHHHHCLIIVVARFQRQNISKFYEPWRHNFKITHVITDSQLWILSPCSQFNGSLFELKGHMKKYAKCTQEIGFKTIHLRVDTSFAMCIVQFLLKSEKPLLTIIHDNLARC
jgi:hypothetical protein